MVIPSREGNGPTVACACGAIWPRGRFKKRVLPDCPRCDPLSATDPDVREYGTRVFVTNSIGARDLEAWVRLVARESGQRVDWYWSGTDAVVRALGNVARVETAIAVRMPEHDALWNEALKRIGLDPSKPPREDWGIQ